MMHNDWPKSLYRLKILEPVWGGDSEFATNGRHVLPMEEFGHQTETFIHVIALFPRHLVPPNALNVFWDFKIDTELLTAMPTNCPFRLRRPSSGLNRIIPCGGALKIRDKILKEFPMIRPPAKSTIGAALDRNGPVKRRRRCRHHAQGTGLSDAQTPNQLWCVDYKGQFMLGNKKYCYPLTIERIMPSKPQQNSRHERWHLTLKLFCSLHQ